MVTITWQDGDNTPEQYTISDDVLVSLEKFRLSSHFQIVKGDAADSIHASVKAMLYTSLMEVIVKPALLASPTPAIAYLHSQVEDSKKQLADAHAAAIAPAP
jgi:hypothetical protein